jgi:protein-S-isoprenylcysteine O-methyltransferase Ste14
LIIFFITMGVWISFEILLVILDSGTAFKVNSQNSKVILLLSIITLTTAAVFSRFPIAYLAGSEDIHFIIGTVIMWQGLLLRLWSIYSLGGLFSTAIGVNSEQRIITSGPYKYIRHPSYMGSLIIFLGFTIAMGNIIGIFTTLILMSLGYYLRMDMEEKHLLYLAGEQYKEYMSRTKKLIPLIY